MKKISQLGIVFTGLLLTISIIQEPASAIPGRWIKDGAEWIWDTGRRQVDDWRVNPRQNQFDELRVNPRTRDRNPAEKARDWYLQDEEAHIKACQKGVEVALESRGDQQDDMNFYDFRRSSKVTRYGCREVTDQLY